MKLFDLIRGARRKASDLDEPSRQKLLQAWGLDENDWNQAGTATLQAPRPDEASRDYDRMQWQRKLKRVLDELPDSEPEWPQLLTEAKAKGFEDDWVRQQMLDEFSLMVRRAVADRHFNEHERRKLDLARYLIGLTTQEAESIYAKVVKEAESFFGENVERQ